MAIHRHKHGAPYVGCDLVAFSSRGCSTVKRHNVLQEVSKFNKRWPAGYNPQFVRMYAGFDKYRVHGASATTNMWYHPTKGWRVTRKDPAPGILKMLKLCQKAWYQPLVTKV